MAEVLQEPVYLTYGNNAQIKLDDFLNAVSNNVENYLALQPWSNKRKNLFRAAYLDIMSRGVTGASNATGIWNVHHNGNLIDLDSLSKKEREMYGEAAYFIQQLMSTLPTKLQQEAEVDKKKSELPLFDNNYLTTQFQGYIGNKMFGGRDWDRNTDWNTLDEADKNGIRGITNRANKLADMLEGYVSTLKDGEYNFEGSPFTDLNDFKVKAAAAIAALRSSDPNDDRDALNQIGLNIRDYLSTGADEIVQVGDRQMTRGEAAQALQLVEQQELQLQQQLLQQQIVNNNYFSKIARGNLSGTDVSKLVDKYKDDNGLILGLNGLASKLVLSVGDWKDLKGAFDLFNNNGRLVNLSSEEINMFRRLPGYLRLSPSTLKKMPGVEGFYYDTRTNQVIQAFTPEMLAVKDSKAISYGDLLSSQSKEAKQLAYLNRPAEAVSGFTDAEWAELGGIVADIASIIDPEPFTAAGFGLAAAGARHYARGQEPGDWGFWDYVKQAGDYVTGAIGAIPIVGDAILVGKTIRGLRMLGRSGAWLDMVNNYPQIKDIWNNKIMGDESMTAGDWKALAEFIRGIVGHGKLNLSHIALRKVLEHRGVLVAKPSEVSGMKAKAAAWAEKTGFVRPQAVKQAKGKTKVDVVKVKINGKETDIEISAKSKSDLEKALRGTKDQAGRDAKVREVPEVKEAAKSLKVDISKVEAVPSHGRLSRIGKSILRRESESSFGTKIKDSTPVERTGTDDFKNWIETRGTWDKIKYGNNRTMRNIDRLFLNAGIYDINGNSSAITGSTGSTEGNTPVNDAFVNSNRRLAREYRNAISRAMDPKGSSKAIKLTDGVAESEITINGKQIKFKYIKDSNGKYKLEIDNAGSKSTRKLNNDNAQADFDVKKLVAKTIEEARSAGRSAARQSKKANDLKMKDLVQQVRKLRRLGFLLNGGTIETTISEFLNKQK